MTPSALNHEPFISPFDHTKDDLVIRPADNGGYVVEVLSGPGFVPARSAFSSRADLAKALAAAFRA